MRGLNLVGQKFHRLTVIERSSGGERVKWKCVCECGAERLVDTSKLTSGHTKSCGCYKIDATKLSNTKHGEANKTHEYRIWNAMKRRCDSPSQVGYKNYGGRGIKVCERWLSYENFLADMGRANSMTLERIDSNADYGPDNCKWANIYEQANNKRNNTKYTYSEKTLTIPQWSRETGIKRSTLSMRLHKYKWTIDEAINTPALRRH
jgi:hypothetical protein